MAVKGTAFTSKLACRACRTMTLTYGRVLRARQDRRVHLAFPRIIPSSNLLTTALPLLYHASDLTISYLTVSRILNLIKHERAEPAVTRARPHTTQTLLPQLHKIQRSVCLVFFFYDILQGSTLSYLLLLIFPDPFPCAARVISQFTTWPIYLVF